jgi:hypothetical protein
VGQRSNLDLQHILDMLYSVLPLTRLPRRLPERPAREGSARVILERPSRASTMNKESPLKKNHPASPSSRRTRLTAEQKQEIREHRNCLLQKWGAGLDSPSIDWEQLFDVHWELELLERRYPWLKKAVA